MALCETLNYSLSSSDHSFASDSDDSQEDPTFDFLEETRSSFSRLSVKKKSKSRIAKEKDEDTEGEPYVIEMAVPELDEKDQKSYDSIQKVIEAGQVQKLKVDQCKIYLRKHGLRLTGTKDILIQRIKEHLEILNGGGEKKYPPSSFIVNCKGDACTGDVVLFEQNVYEMFSIASRCANGPPCGTRVIAGRIVKESYGAAKQQHTFTIEVLWSKGEKPLPPLHPLLIKGRNLYRLKTMRQKWEDEGERQKILTEKHARGCVARSKRETRVQQREMKKMLKSNRNGEDTGKQKINPPSFPSKNMANQPQQQTENMQDTNQAQCFIERPTTSGNAKMPLNRLRVQRPPLTSIKGNRFVVPFDGHYWKPNHSTSSYHPGSNEEGPAKHNTPGNSVPERCAYQESVNLNAVKSSFRGHKESSVQKHFRYGSLNFNPLRSAKPTHAHAGLKNFNAAEDLVPGPKPENIKVCRYYAQGRCYYGQNCKYLHQC